MANDFLVKDDNQINPKPNDNPMKMQIVIHYEMSKMKRSQKCQKNMHKE